MNKILLNVWLRGGAMAADIHIKDIKDEALKKMQEMGLTPG